MDENVNDAAAIDGDGNSRRDLIKKAAIGGAVVWAAPTLLAGRAAAASPPLPPSPPGCTFSQITDWNTVTITPPLRVISFNGTPIGTTGWTGNNVDVLRGSPPVIPTMPPWVAPNTWVDLIGGGTAGNISTSFVVPCTGTYELSFLYSQYAGSPSALTTNVNGHINGPLPTPVSPTLFQQQYTLNTGQAVTIVLSGTGTASIGPAITNVSFLLL